MKPIDEEVYRDIKIECFYNRETKCFSANSKIVSSSNKFEEDLGNFCMGFSSVKDALTDVKAKIDLFLSSQITSYKQLAEEITETLHWTGYEDCHVDEQVLKLLLEKFKAKCIT